MAIESKFSDEEIKAFSSSNHNAIVLKHYAWKICLETTRDYNDTMAILENRMTEIRESYDSKNQDEQTQLEQEWISLVIHKDNHLRQKIQDENEKIKNQYIVQLYDTLKVLGTFSFPSQRDAIFGRNLAKMFHQVGKYCTRNEIHTNNDSNKESLKTVDQPVIASIPMPPPLPPPPPPPPPPPQQLFYKPKTQSQSPQTPKMQRNSKTGSAQTSNEQRTPLHSLNNDLLRSIKRGRALELKRTPCKRSPGGTPMKRQRRLSESDTSDLITMALRRKFKNANTISSPKENLSSNVASPMSPCHEYP